MYDCNDSALKGLPEDLQHCFLRCSYSGVSYSLNVSVDLGTIDSSIRSTSAKSPSGITAKDDQIQEAVGQLAVSDQWQLVV